MKLSKVVDVKVVGKSNHTLKELPTGCYERNGLGFQDRVGISST